MVELIGKIAETKVENGNLVDKWRIPAQSEAFARRQTQANATVKGRSDTNIVSVEKVGEGELPGQSIYEVVTQSAR